MVSVNGINTCIKCKAAEERKNNASQLSVTEQDPGEAAFKKMGEPVTGILPKVSQNNAYNGR